MISNIPIDLIILICSIILSIILCLTTINLLNDNLIFKAKALLTLSMFNWLSILISTCIIYLFSSELYELWITDHYNLSQLITTNIYLLLLLIGSITVLMADIHEQYILDYSTYIIGFANVGLLLCFIFIPQAIYEPFIALYFNNLYSHIASFVCTALIFGSTYIYKKEAIGEGDLLLLAAITPTLGIINLLTLLNYTFISAAIFAIINLVLYKDRTRHMALGPFIVLAYLAILYIHLFS